MSRLDDLLPSLACPDCGCALERRAERLVCAGQAAHGFAVRGGVPVFLDAAEETGRDRESETFFNQLKAWLKRQPRLYRGLTALFSPVLLVDRTRIVKRRFAGTQALVVNVGSGPVRPVSGIVALDFFPYVGVDVVASATRLPFATDSVDGVLCEYVLEHVPDAAGAIAEIRRVLKPGGLVYVTVPFLEPYHESPSDYYRWTASGVPRMFPGYEPIERGVAEGPTGTLNWVLQEWLALVLSLGWEPLRRVWAIVLMLLLWPLKVVDYGLMRLPQASNIAAATYYVARKPPRGDGPEAVV